MGYFVLFANQRDWTSVQPVVSYKIRSRTMTMLDLFQLGFLIIVVIVGVGGLVTVLFKKEK